MCLCYPFPGNASVSTRKLAKNAIKVVSTVRFAGIAMEFYVKALLKAVQEAKVEVVDRKIEVYMAKASHEADGVMINLGESGKPLLLGHGNPGSGLLTTGTRSIFFQPSSIDSLHQTQRSSSPAATGIWRLPSRVPMYFTTPFRGSSSTASLCSTI